MLLEDARQSVQRFLAPLPLDRFLDEILGRTIWHQSGPEGASGRQILLGPDPEAIVLNAYERLAPTLASHAVEPKGPAPKLERVGGAIGFGAKIAAFHDRGYTIRTDDVRALSPVLESLIRAFEVLFHQPAGVKLFWSRAGGKAPVHYDEYDLIVVQLRGRKRWLVSNCVSDLPNTWKKMPANPELQLHTELVMERGDFLYMPRGTTHCVECLSDSLHLSIGFIPVTLRDALIACIDRLSDIHRPLRETVGARIGSQVRSGDFGDILERAREGAAALAGYCRSDAFIADALQHRSSQAVAKLEKLASGSETPLTPETLLRQNPLAAAHVIGNASEFDFAYPGGHHYVNRGAQESLAFILRTKEFRLRDIPGLESDQARMALAERFVSCGFLQAVA